MIKTTNSVPFQGLDKENFADEYELDHDMNLALVDLKVRSLKLIEEKLPIMNGISHQCLPITSLAKILEEHQGSSADSIVGIQMMKERTVKSVERVETYPSMVDKEKFTVMSYEEFSVSCDDESFHDYEKSEALSPDSKHKSHRSNNFSIINECSPKISTKKLELRRVSKRSRSYESNSSLGDYKPPCFGQA